eukprot:g126.t1
MESVARGQKYVPEWDELKQGLREVIEFDPFLDKKGIREAVHENYPLWAVSSRKVADAMKEVKAEIEAEKKAKKELKESDLRNKMRVFVEEKTKDVVKNCLYDMEHTKKGKRALRIETQKQKNIAITRRRMTKNLPKSMRKEHVMKETFLMYDMDGSGCIDFDEFGLVLRDLCMPLNKAKKLEAFKAIDKDGSGEIDLAEFKRWYNGKASSATGSGASVALAMVRLKAKKAARDLAGSQHKFMAQRTLCAKALKMAQVAARQEFLDIEEGKSDSLDAKKEKGAMKGGDMESGSATAGVSGGALPCIECNEVANRLCYQCNDAFCDKCWDEIHASPGTKVHTFKRVNVEYGTQKCVQCGKEDAVRVCHGCNGDQYCLACFGDVHSKGRRAKHEWAHIPVFLGLFEESNYDISGEGFGKNGDLGFRPLMARKRDTEEQIARMRKIKVNGALSPNGISIAVGHRGKPAWVEYWLGGYYGKLETTLGFSDDVGNKKFRNPIVFEIFGDGDLLHSFKAIRSSKSQFADVDIGGVETMRLSVRSEEPGPGNHMWAHCIFMEPKITEGEGQRKGRKRVQYDEEGNVISTLGDIAAQYAKGESEWKNGDNEIAVEEIEDNAVYFDPSKTDNEMLMNRILFETSEHAESTGHHATGRVIVMNKGAKFRKPEQPKFVRQLEKKGQVRSAIAEAQRAAEKEEQNRNNRMEEIERQNKALRAQLWYLNKAPVA